MIEQLHHIDQELTLAINSLHCPASDLMWQTFSNKEIWFAMYAIVLVFMFIKLGWRRALLWTVGIALMVVLCDQFANIVKAAVARLRPCHNEYMTLQGLRILEGTGGRYGFYSAHAANALVFAIGSVSAFRSGGYRCRGWAWLISCWAVLVGVSRIFVGKHYLGDVLVGFAVALIIGFGLSAIVRLIEGRLSFFRKR